MSSGTEKSTDEEQKQETRNDECRFCKDTLAGCCGKEHFKPCLCNSNIHRECLMTWLDYKKHSNQNPVHSLKKQKSNNVKLSVTDSEKIRCEVCQFEFKMETTHNYKKCICGSFAFLMNGLWNSCMKQFIIILLIITSGMLPTLISTGYTFIELMNGDLETYQDADGNTHSSSGNITFYLVIGSLLLILINVYPSLYNRDFIILNRGYIADNEHAFHDIDNAICCSGGFCLCFPDLDCGTQKNRFRERFVRILMINAVELMTCCVIQLFGTGIYNLFEYGDIGYEFSPNLQTFWIGMVPTSIIGLCIGSIVVCTPLCKMALVKFGTEERIGTNNV
jgi:hypothetical protein